MARPRAVLVVARLVVDRRAGDVAQAELLVAERLAERPELAGADGGSDDGAERVALALLDALGEFDLAFAREERHAGELLEVGGDRVGRRVAGGGGANGLKGKGSCHYRLMGEYGVTWLFGLSGNAPLDSNVSFHVPRIRATSAVTEFDEIVRVSRGRSRSFRSA